MSFIPLMDLKKSILWAKRCRNRDSENCFELLVGTKPHSCKPMNTLGEVADLILGKPHLWGFSLHSDLLAIVLWQQSLPSNIHIEALLAFLHDCSSTVSCRCNFQGREEACFLATADLPAGCSWSDSSFCFIHWSSLMWGVSWVKSLMLRGFSCEKPKPLP